MIEIENQAKRTPVLYHLIQWLIKWWQNQWASVEIFFSTGASLYALGLMRVLVSGSLCILYLWRQLEVEYFFTDAKGLILKDQAFEMIPQFIRSPFIFFIWPETWIPAVHGLLIFCLLLLFLGIGNRLTTLFTWFLCLGFFQRNMFVAYGADLVGSLWLFYLSWTKHNVYWSVLNFFKKERIQKIQVDLFTHAGYRMIQIQVSIIYAYSGMQKLKGPSWWDGTSLWTVLGSSQLAIFDFQWLVRFPLMVGVLVFSTLFFEVYFPFLVWNKNTRVPILVFGFLFHLGIAVTMGIWAFSTIMVSSYLLFLYSDPQADNKDYRLLKYLQWKVPST